MTIHVTTAYITGKCSLGCPYCYSWKRLGYNMPQDVMEQMCIYLNASGFTRSGPVLQELKLWGGEPLEYPEGLKFVLGHARPRKFTITTNGLNLTPDMFEWLRFHAVEIALSWDGTKDSQDQGRQNSYDKLKPNIEYWRTLIAENGGQILKTVAIPENLYADVEEIYNAGFER
ncbi:unnamed protein product, partial [marine sediment metagenome]